MGPTRTLGNEKGQQASTANGERRARAERAAQGGSGSRGAVCERRGREAATRLVREAVGHGGDRVIPAIYINRSRQPGKKNRAHVAACARQGTSDYAGLHRDDR